MRMKEIRCKKRRRKGSILLFLFIFFLSPLTLPVQAQTPFGISSERSSGGIPKTSRNNSRSNRTNNNNAYNNADSAYVDTSATKGLEYHEEVPDSVLRSKVFFFLYNTHTVKIDELWNPTLDPTGVQFSNDPIDAFNGNYFLGKGSPGHQHWSLFPTLANGLAYRLQDEEFAAYLKTPANIRFYQVLTPYTVLAYNNSLKKDYLVEVAHTQNIIPGWNVAANYRLINPEGVISGTNAKNHYLDVTTNYFSDDARLQAQAGFIWQSFSTGENGGLSDDRYFTDNLMNNFAGLPVRYYNSGSNHLRHNAFGRFSYNFVRQVERTRERDSLVVNDDIIDTVVVTDTLRVGTPHVINAGVLGLEADYSRWKRSAYLTGFADSALWNEASATLFWTNDAYLDHRWRNPLKITIGITPRRLEAVVRADTTTSHDTLTASSLFNPFAKVELQLGKATLSATGEIDNTLKALSPLIKEADYHAAASFLVPLDSLTLWGRPLTTLEVYGAIQSALPSVRMLNATGYTLAPIKSERYGLRLRHDSEKGLLRMVDLNINASHMDHNVWYDSLLTVQTGSKDLWLGQAALTLRMAWGWFHVDMQQLLQYSTDEEQLAVPRWASKNSVYADLTLFGKALRMQIGADIRCYTRFTPDGYHPGTGLFYQQDVETGNYWWGDLFLNLQVKRASIYLKAGHLNALWESNPQYFLLPHYPGRQFGLYWGLIWHFFD